VIAASHAAEAEHEAAEEAGLEVGAEPAAGGRRARREAAGVGASAREAAGAELRRLREELAASEAVRAAELARIRLAEEVESERAAERAAEAQRALAEGWGRGVRAAAGPKPPPPPPEAWVCEPKPPAAGWIGEEEKRRAVVDPEAADPAAAEPAAAEPEEGEPEEGEPEEGEPEEGEPERLQAPRRTRRVFAACPMLLTRPPGAPQALLRTLQRQRAEHASVVARGSAAIGHALGEPAPLPPLSSSLEAALAPAIGSAVPPARGTADSPARERVGRSAPGSQGAERRVETDELLRQYRRSRGSGTPAASPAAGAAGDGEVAAAAGTACATLLADQFDAHEEWVSSLRASAEAVHATHQRAQAALASMMPAGAAATLSRTPNK